MGGILWVKTKPLITFHRITGPQKRVNIFNLWASNFPQSQLTFEASVSVNISLLTLPTVNSVWGNAAPKAAVTSKAKISIRYPWGYNLVYLVKILLSILQMRRNNALDSGRPNFSLWFNQGFSFFCFESFSRLARLKNIFLEYSAACMIESVQFYSGERQNCQETVMQKFSVLLEAWS